MTFTHSEVKSFLSRLTEIIEAHLSDERFGVSELAREMGMSRSNLHRKLKAAKGISLSTYIRQIRLERARDLLKQSPSTVSQIAFEVGFSSVTYFSKCFHDHFGYSPGEIRKGNNANPDAGAEEPPPVRTRVAFRGKRVSLTFLIVLSTSILTAAILLIWFDPFGPQKTSLDKSIAVLPFINDSPEETEMYFINGTMEAIRNNLCKIKELRVVSRNSVEQYRHHPKPTRVVAEEMNVSYVLEGSGMKQGERIFLTLQLIDARNDRHIWSESYQKNAEDVFELYSEVAQHVAGEIEVFITPEEKERIEKIPSINQTAIDLHLRASELIYWGSRSEDMNQGIELSRYALEFDSAFATPYYSIAEAYFYLYNRNPIHNRSYLDSVLVYSNKTISLNDQDDGAYRLKGGYYQSTGNVSEALENYNRAIELNPNFWLAYNSRGWFYFAQNQFSLAIENLHKSVQLNRGYEPEIHFKTLGFIYMVAGFPEKYLEIMDEALAMDGDSVDFYRRYSEASWVAGNNEKALVAAQKAYILDTSDLYVLRQIMGIYYDLENHQEALTYCDLYLNRMEELGQFIPYNISLAIHLLRQAGRFEEANEYLNQLLNYCTNKSFGANRSGHIFTMAEISALAGDSEQVYSYLTELWQQPKLNVWVTHIRTHPLFKKYQHEPEFLQICEKIERKFDLQREQTRQWLEENDMWY